MGRCERRVRDAVALTVIGAALAGCTDPTRNGLAHDDQAHQHDHAISASARQRADWYRENVDAIARWLEATAVATEHGLAWPVAPDRPAAPAAATATDDRGATPTDLYSGSAGVVLFFLELCESCERPGASDGTIGRDATDQHDHWFSIARRGADHLLATLPEKAVRDEANGLYTGIAGVGFVLLEAGRALTDERYTTGARRCVSLLHQAAYAAGPGIEWGSTTDVIAGGAGIGLFLLTMYERTGDGVALELATRAGRRLLDLSQREAVGRSWRMDPTFPRVMPNFSHGTAGVAYFLARLFEVTKVEAFLDGARDGADHLLSLADSTDGGCRIYHHTPDGTDLYYLGWCHGPTGTARLFTQLADVTGEQRWTDLVRCAAQSLLSSGIPDQPQPGFWNNVGQCCGSAGVIEFSLALALATGDESYAGFARELAANLIGRGRRDARGLCFPQAEHRTKPDLIEAQTGYAQGAAGIAIALLHLEVYEHAPARGDALQALGIVLPDSPFTAPSGRVRTLPNR